MAERKCFSELAIVLPSLNPDMKFKNVVDGLIDAGFEKIVIVNDGSDAEHSARFAEAAEKPQCVVLDHGVNRGKGRALKTAFEHVLREMPMKELFVTVDADGQHDPEDCRHVVEKLIAEKADVCLGERAFSLRTTPFRSWWGNRWTSLAFFLRRGRWFADTQTGLRAFRWHLLPLLTAIPGAGYEYEMAALCALVRQRCRICVQPIRTIYEKGNASSHYDPLRDTIRVLRALFARTSV